MKVRVYATLRPIVGSRCVVLRGNCKTVKEALDELIASYPALSDRLLDQQGAVRSYVALMLNGRDIRHLDGLNTAVGPDSELDIFPPIAGGGA